MADVSAGEKLKVFISYSREDSAEFADELVAENIVLPFDAFSSSARVFGRVAFG
jgi:hypothetical protein